MLKVLDALHKKKNFQKIQEVFGYEIEDGLRILEGEQVDGKNGRNQISKKRNKSLGY